MDEEKVVAPKSTQPDEAILPKVRDEDRDPHPYTELVRLIDKRHEIGKWQD